MRNRTVYAVLGMLALHPRSGYDLKKDFERGMAHFWSESVGQIYPALHTLREEGLVTGRAQKGQRGRDRTVYSITARGRRTLQAWLVEPPEPDRIRNELLLKLFFGPEMPREVALKHIQTYERGLSALLRRYAGFHAEIDRLAPSKDQAVYWHLVLELGEHVQRARVRWCQKARHALRENHVEEEQAT